MPIFGNHSRHHSLRAKFGEIALLAFVRSVWSDELVRLKLVMGSAGFDSGKSLDLRERTRNVLCFVFLSLV